MVRKWYFSSPYVIFILVIIDKLSLEGIICMDNIYNNGTYLENNPSWHVEDSPWKAANILKMIRNNNIDPNLVCEIGCGAGEILIHLSKRLGQHVIFHGYEISKQAYDLCVQTNNDRVTYFLKDMLSSQDRDYYDLILIIDLI